MHRKTIGHLISLTLLSIFIISSAWVTEDSFITFRVIDNFWHGHGLRWNIDERVWVATHSLWLFLLLLVSAFSNNLYLISILLGAFLSLLFAHFFLKDQSNFLIKLLLVLCLCSSSAFIDYSTSGLENSASHLLIFLFFFFFLQKNAHSQQLLLLTLISSLIVLNRHDLSLLIIPPMAWLFLKNAKTNLNKIPRAILLGTLPLTAWLCFTIIYYGTIIPNTGLAKLNHGIDSFVLQKQGFFYFLDSIKNDPITISTITLCIAISLYKGQAKHKLLTLGILLYLFYILKIGGDYMSGRFFSTPFVLSLCVLSVLLPPISNKIKALFIIVLTALAINNFLSLFNNSVPPIINGITDERQFYSKHLKLITQPNISWKEHVWYKAGQIFKASPTTIITCNIGLLGYSSGQQVKIIDTLALSDPLLARLPSLKKFRIGHFPRKIPKGYVESIKMNTNNIEHPLIHQIYNDIRLVTQGPLFSQERFNAIWRLHTQSLKIDQYEAEPFLYNENSKLCQTTRISSHRN